jgi:hypothetical protein
MILGWPFPLPPVTERIGCHNSVIDATKRAGRILFDPIPFRAACGMGIKRALRVSVSSAMQVRYHAP